MSTTYTFRPGERVTVGEATKKSEYDYIAENTDEMDERLEARPVIDDLLAKTGNVSYFFNATTGNPTQLRFYTGPIGTIDFAFNTTTDNLKTVKLRLSDPQDVTITETYAFSGTTGDLLSISRVVT